MEKIYEVEGGINAPIGFKSAGIACGIKSGAKDLAIIYSMEQCTTTGVFTTNRVKAAPLILSELHLEDGTAQAVIINSGNANACTGPGGHADAAEMARLTASELAISSEQIVVASTGVIGVKLPFERIKTGIKSAVKCLDDTPEAALDAAEAIMTTDTSVKSIALEFETSEGFIKVGGMAKGSGMIAPKMATMLAFITTDAKISQPILSNIFQSAVNDSFNSITIDAISTNDMAIIMANGLSGISIHESSDDYDLFNKAVHMICMELATAMVKDAEGATKLVEIVVDSAESNDSARKIARAIAESNLVKTAIYGGDPNWGRIIAAAGSAGTKLSPCMLSLEINGEEILQNGVPLNYDEESVKALMDLPEIKIRLGCNIGAGHARILTADLTEEYIRINARYRT